MSLAIIVVFSTYSTINGIDAPNDSDGDGLSDDDEAFYGTDPQNPDTDNDGQSDKYEIDQGSDPLIDDSHFSSFQDTDEDGLPDVIERAPKGEHVFVDGVVMGTGTNTNPEISDSDGDGFSDGEEIKNGTDPKDSDSKPARTESDGLMIAWIPVAIGFITYVIFSRKKNR